MNYVIVVAWHDKDQRDKFCEAWGIDTHGRDWLILQQDKHKEGCAVTKNKGIIEALHREADVIMVLDDDCLPYGMKLDEWAEHHLAALEPVEVELYQPGCDPPSRGTPYYSLSVKLPVAASMGFWLRNPDYDAPRTLVDNDPEPVFHREPMFWRFFPFSGMNCAFKREFWPHFKFDETAPRFDDIFMGYRLQSEAYKRGHCINLRGPLVQHIRQSNVWDNLKVEAQNLERNEDEWKLYV